MSKNTKQIWVSPNQGNGWKIQQPGNTKASAVTKTKAEAIEKAQSIAKNQGLETKIQRQDGTIQGGNSYGYDPYPPQG